MNYFETVREGIGYSQDVPEADDAYAAAEAALAHIEAENERLTAALELVVEGYEAPAGNEFDWSEWYDIARAALAKEGLFKSDRNGVGPESPEFYEEEA